MDFKTIEVVNKRVPELIFGSLTMAPLQRNMTPEDGGKIIAAGLKQGLRWIDTAQMYGSYPHVKYGINSSGINRDEIIISSKSTGKTYQEMTLAIDEALAELDTEYIDIFLMHAVKSEIDYKEKEGALNALIDAKVQGKIGSVGLSTHSTKFAHFVASDERIEWYHLMFNKKGTGLTDGNLDDQLTAMKRIKDRGAKIYAMKPLGGGYLKNIAEEALIWVKDHPLVDAVALGMTSLEELEMNIKIFKNKIVSKELSDKLKAIKKDLFVFKALCIGCSICVKECEQNAIILVENRADVIEDKCILCGYCVPTCPKFALRII